MIKSEASTEWQTLFINKVQCLVPYFTLENPLLLINKKFNKEGIKLLTKELVEVERTLPDDFFIRTLEYVFDSYSEIYDTEKEFDDDPYFEYVQAYKYGGNTDIKISFQTCGEDPHGLFGSGYCKLAFWGSFTINSQCHEIIDNTDRCFLTNDHDEFNSDDWLDYIKVFACDRFIIVQTENTQIIWDHESKRFNQYNDGQMKLRLSNMTLRDVFSYNDMEYKAYILISHDDYVVCFEKINSCV